MIGTVAVLDKQGVGTVTLAFEGDTLHVVWSSFAADKNRYTLKWLKWPAAGAPTTPQNIGTGVLPAYAPALAIDGGRFLLAWTEGDDRTASVKVGASRNGIANIPGLATVASTLGTMGSGPAVAEEGDAMFVVWKEKGALAEVRSSALKCQE